MSGCGSPPATSSRSIRSTSVARPRRHAGRRATPGRPHLRRPGRRSRRYAARGRRVSPVSGAWWGSSAVEPARVRRRRSPRPGAPRRRARRLLRRSRRRTRRSRCGADLPAGEGGVPDRAGALPANAADRGGREVEGAVGDAGVEVHPTVVVVGVDVLVHRGALRVLAQPGVVVGGARVRHVAEAPGRDAGHEEPGPDQPVRLIDALREQPLLEAGAEDVADRLVECSRTGPGSAARRCAR